MFYGSCIVSCMVANRTLIFIGGQHKNDEQENLHYVSAKNMNGKAPLHQHPHFSTAAGALH
jgi:hypothetical protein